MTEVDPIVSEYMKSLNAKRKNKVGGFSDPAVRKKAEATKAKKKADGVG